MFHGGFGEADGTLSDENDDDGMEPLSDSDGEDEATDLLSGPFSGSPQPSSPPRPAGTHTPPGSDGVRSVRGRNGDRDDGNGDEESHDGAETSASGNSSNHSASDEETDGSGEGRDKTIAAAAPLPVSRKRARDDGGVVAGPRKTRVVVRDSAWSTWWAVLYWASLLSSLHILTTALHRRRLLCAPLFVLRRPEDYDAERPGLPSRMDGPMALRARHDRRVG